MIIHSGIVSFIYILVSLCHIPVVIFNVIDTSLTREKDFDVSIDVSGGVETCTKKESLYVKILCVSVCCLCVDKLCQLMLQVQEYRLNMDSRFK